MNMREKMARAMVARRGTHWEWTARTRHYGADATTAPVPHAFSHHDIRRV